MYATSFPAIIYKLTCLTQLEQTIDFSAWQKEYETARVQDHHTLMSVGRRLEQGNVAILTELTRQGASLTQLSAVMKVSVLPCVHRILTDPWASSQSLRANTESDIGLPSAIAEDDDFVSDLLDEGVPRPRAMSAPALVVVRTCRGRVQAQRPKPFALTVILHQASLMGAQDQHSCLRIPSSSNIPASFPVVLAIPARRYRDVRHKCRRSPDAASSILHYH